MSVLERVGKSIAPIAMTTPFARARLVALVVAALVVGSRDAQATLRGVGDVHTLKIGNGLPSATTPAGFLFTDTDSSNVCHQTTLETPNPPFHRCHGRRVFFENTGSQSEL
jgi:hypothetical protein